MASGKAGFKHIQEIARPNAAKPHHPLSFVGFRLVSYVVDDGVCVCLDGGPFALDSFLFERTCNLVYTITASDL